MSNSVDNTSPRILIDNPSKSISENIFDIKNLQLNRFSMTSWEEQQNYVFLKKWSVFLIKLHSWERKMYR